MLTLSILKTTSLPFKVSETRCFACSVVPVFPELSTIKRFSESFILSSLQVINEKQPSNSSLMKPVRYGYPAR